MKLRVKTLFTIALKLIKYPVLNLTREVQTSYEKSNGALLKVWKKNLKTRREDPMLQEEKGRHGQEIYSPYTNP